MPSAMLARPVAAAKSRPRPRPGLVPDVQHFVFEDVSWGFYERLLREVGNGPTRLTYDQGRLEVTSPLPGHEQVSRVLCLFVFDLAIAGGLPIAMCGSTTLRRRLRRRGLEPDECFYIANEHRIRGKPRLSFPRDPPPDLAVEIDVTNSSIPRMPIYAALGVPEVWRYAGGRLRCLHLRDGKYASRPRSLSFPGLRPADLTPFVRQAERIGQAAATVAFRGWLADR